MGMTSRFSVVYVNPSSACDGGKEEEEGSGPEVDFLLSSLHLSFLNSATVQTLPYVFPQGFCSNNMGERINIIIAAFNVFVIKPREN